MVANVEDPVMLSHLIAGALRLKTEEKQELLEELDVAKRLRRLSEILARELEVVAIGTKIQSQVQSELEKGQREYFLRQQLKAIQDELGEGDEVQAEVNELREQLDALTLPEEVRKQVDRELGRLERLQPAMAEYGVVRSYLEWIASLPWDKSTEDNLDLAHARQVLDEDHYDIEQVKDRILEFLAVRSLMTDANRQPGGSILCFVGPAGRRQDLAGPLDRPGAGPQVRAHQRRRRARRGRDPRPPADLHRRDARRDHPRAARRRRQQPAVHDRRDRQDGRRLPRRSGERDARGARPRAEQHLPRPLPRPAVRPVERDVRHHGEHAGDDPGAAARPHGGDPARRLHPGREARDRQALSRAAPDRAQRADPGPDRVHRLGAGGDHLRLHARGRACASSSGRSAPSCARSPARSPRARPSARSRSPSRGSASCSGRPQVPLRGAPADVAARRGHRAGLDAGRGRGAVRRGDGDAGQRPPDDHRPARRRHAGVGPGRAVLRPRQRAGAVPGAARPTGSPPTTSTSTCPRGRSPRTVPAPG